METEVPECTEDFLSSLKIRPVIRLLDSKRRIQRRSLSDCSWVGLIYCSSL